MFGKILKISEIIYPSAIIAIFQGRLILEAIIYCRTFHNIKIFFAESLQWYAVDQNFSWDHTAFLGPHY